jgi:hypothetical protein
LLQKNQCVPDVFRVGFRVAFQNAPGLFGETAGPFGRVGVVGWIWFVARAHVFNMAFFAQMSVTNRLGGEWIEQKITKETKGKTETGLNAKTRSRKDAKRN